jgi:hypothetical protein
MMCSFLTRLTVVFLCPLFFVPHDSSSPFQSITWFAAVMAYTNLLFYIGSAPLGVSLRSWVFLLGSFPF